MCGIAGIANYTVEPVSNILAMNKMLFRRGPDAGNYWLEENAKVVLGHRRLAIVDLSEKGAQPMISKDERYVITYNGEIYNYQEIKKGMEAERGPVNLRGTSDTELLLEAISFYGFKKTLTLAKGMFAIAVYDRQEKKLYLTRDRMGEKPLYYGLVNGSFVFSSDLAAIRQIENFHNPINEQVLPLYFRHGYIPMPYSVYEGIYKLKQGTILETAYPFQEWKQETYWDIKEVAVKGQENLFKGSEEEATAELKKRLLQAIEGQMMADVPLGAFLSGGIDSTLVVSLMQSLSKEKIRTFTIGFREDGYNEATYAKETAEYLGTNHTEMYVGFSEVMDILPRLPIAYAEPFADSSQIPTMLVSKMTREHVTVSLSGDAGDEFYCGYNTYLEAQRGLAILKGKGAFLPSTIRSGIGNLCKRISNEHTPLLYKVGKVFTTDTLEDFARSISLSDHRTGYISKKKGLLPTDYNQYSSGYLQGAENNLMLMDMLQYLPDDILVKVDRAGMYYSLESRIPLLDRDVCEFAWRLPLEYKFNNRITKKVLRNILYQYVPKEMMERPKKGFSIPISKWLLDGEMNEWAESILSDGRQKMPDILNQRVVESLWREFKQTKEFTPTIWYILMLEQWMLEQ